jgi:hypothetical protein
MQRTTRRPALSLQQCARQLLDTPTSNEETMSFQSICIRATVTEATYARYLCSYNGNNKMKEPKKKIQSHQTSTRANVQFGRHDVQPVRRPSSTPQRRLHTVSQTPRVRELVAADFSSATGQHCLWKLLQFARPFGVLDAYPARRILTSLWR